MRKYNVALVGATGLVGRTILKVIKEYNFPIGEIRLFASQKSLGKALKFKNKNYYVELLNESSFLNSDIVFFSAGKEVSKEWVKVAVNSGALVIDNSSFFRCEKSVPLIVPEINIGAYNGKRLIANPNCSTIQCVLPLSPLDKKYKIKKIAYTTFQAVSGSGMKGINDLYATLRGEKPKFYKYDISKTCIPQIGEFDINGYTEEELKMIRETKKILGNNHIKISATCVRVPIENSHGVSCQVQFKNSFDINEVREILSNSKGVKVVDDIKSQSYPLSTLSNNNDFVYVGRIRKDFANKNSLNFYCTCDNVRKGAGANAVQIALELIKLGKI